jgi:hypothetical protein
MKPEDPTPTGRIPLNTEAPADLVERAPSRPQDRSAPAQRTPARKPAMRPRRRKKPFVL